jgi:DNA-directed RNA polymerase subunit RPC12/RpoP
LAEEKVTSGNSAVLQGNVNIHCFVCGTKVSVEGKVPGTNVNCKSCDTKLTVPDEDVLKKLASFESFTEIPSGTVTDSSSSKKGSSSSKKDSTPSPKEEKPKVVPHKIFCDGCGAKIDVTDQPVGSRFSCPACGMVLRVPERTAAPVEEKEEKKEKVESKDSKPKEAKPSAASDKKKPDSSVSGSPVLEKLKINCHTCGAKIDVTHEESLRR